jgi:hypothetical protein
MSLAMTDALFVVTVLFVFISILYGLNVGLTRLGYDPAHRMRIVLTAALGISLFQGTIGYAAWRGLFLDFTSLPPKFMLAFFSTMIAMLIVAFSPPVKRIAAVIRPSWPIGLQTFRIVIEIVLWQLVLQGRISPMMSFEGRNFDVVTGVTAPIIAWLAATRRYRSIVTLWNIMGMVVLTNVVVRGVLSTPTRFQMIHADPPTTIVATFPYIWLPCIAVASAYFLHIVSLRQRAH